MNTRLLVHTLVAIASAASYLSAAELTVGPGQQFPTITAAITAASTGDSIRVFPGTYVENIHYGGKDLDIFSNSDNYADTIIDGGNVNRTVWIASATAGSLRGFTIQNGNASVGGGLFISFRSPLVQNCLIQQNRAGQAAGAFIQGGQPRFVDCRFFLNQVITAAPIPPDGGGMYVDQSLAEFVNCRIDSNFAPGKGGGIYVRINAGAGSVGASFEDCLIQFNRASTGGGVAVASRNESQFTRCSILNNVADLPPTMGATKNLGGGVYINDSGPDFFSCILADNRAGTTSATVIEGSGGGLYSEAASGPVLESLVEGCTIANNKAGVATQNTGFGGGICSRDGGPVYVRSGILWGNTARTNGQQAAVLPTIAGTWLTLTYCDVQGGLAGVHAPLGGFVSNNILNVNPFFVGPTDYHLTGATLVDAGAPTPVPQPGTLDIDGDPRLLGARVEMGADEFVNCSVVTPYGPLTPNTAGPGAVISLGGSTSVSANNAVLRVSGGPPGHLGIFFYGPDQTLFPVDCGNNLVSGHIQRIATGVIFDASGNANLPVNWTQPPFQGVNAITPGSSWNFQFWYRDSCGAGPSTNKSTAMHITFCP